MENIKERDSEEGNESYHMIFPLNRIQLNKLKIFDATHTHSHTHTTTYSINEILSQHKTNKFSSEAAFLLLHIGKSIVIKDHRNRNGLSRDRQWERFH